MYDLAALAAPRPLLPKKTLSTGNRHWGATAFSSSARFAPGKLAMHSSLRVFRTIMVCAMPCEFGFRLGAGLDQQEWGGAYAQNHECLGMVSSTYQWQSLVGMNLISSKPQVLRST